MIDRIGIELEGGWNNHPPTRIIADLSIDGRTFETDRRLTNAHVGEVVSPPLRREEVLKWLEDNYPNDVNITCGLHVHVSLTSKKEYGLLMNKSFEFMVIENAEALAKDLQLPDTHYIWHRLEGSNPFALFDVIPKTQVGIKEKRIGMRARYAAFNFCFSMHGTIEYRLLPMFKEGPLVANLFIENFLTTLESELRSKRDTTHRMSCSLRERDGVIEERKV